MSIRAFLEGWLYLIPEPHDAKSPWKWMLDNGREFEPDDATFAGKRKAKKQCFQNCTLMAALDRRLRYCEGYVTCCGVAIEHAWLVDADGRIIDPTIRHERGEKPGAYFGAVFNTRYVNRTIMANGFYGVLGYFAKETAARLLSGEEQDWAVEPDFFNRRQAA